MQTICNEQGPKPSVEQLMLLPQGEGDQAAPPPSVAKPIAAAMAEAESKRARRYKQGADPEQPMLLPPRVEDYVAEDNPVRAIKAYVGTLDMEKLGFKYAGGELKAGQRAFAPADLLALYLYGYLNRVHSSRRLEAECMRNLEVIWLLDGLRPGYHTIADFRKDNGVALRAANREFIQLCRDLELFGNKLIGIDGSFFNGNASAGSIKTKKQLEAELKAAERDIERYQQELDDNDAAEKTLPADAVASADQLAALKDRAQKKTEQIEQLKKDGETQLSQTDPDARKLRKNGKTVTGYNVQTAVDDKHKLIAGHEVTNAGNDFGQLVPMIENVEQALHDEAAPEREEPLEVVADAGYFTEENIAACEDKPVEIYVPIPDKHRAVAGGGRLPGSEFQYDAERDVYRCPDGQELPPMGKPGVKNGSLRQRYQSNAAQCNGCPLRTQCLPKKTPVRQIYRSEHADAVDRHRERMSDASEKMRERAALCEHPFGTMKRWLGWDHFLVRGFEKVRGEMALLVNCYNLRRLLSIFGVEGFIAICEARRRRLQTEGTGNRFFGLFGVPSRRLQGLFRRFLRTPRFFPAQKRAAPTAPLMRQALSSMP